METKKPTIGSLAFGPHWAATWLKTYKKKV